HIDIVEGSSGSLKKHVVHRNSDASSSGKPDLAPFKQYSTMIGPFDFLYGALSRISSAVYVICKGSSPTWFQLRYICTMGMGRESQVTLIPMGAERPKVAWT